MGFWRYVSINLIDVNINLGNGCGLNETTKDFPYLYFPAVNVSFSSGNYDVFKYAMCVKSCPKNSSDPVLCKEPKFFA